MGRVARDNAEAARNLRGFEFEGMACRWIPEIDLRLFEEGIGDFLRCFRAELAVPLFNEPLRLREGRRAIRPIDGVAADLAKDRVDQSSGGSLPGALHQF